MLVPPSLSRRRFLGLGAGVGAAVLTALPQFLTVFQEYENATLGLILMACMIFLRCGLLPSLLDLVRRRGDRP